LSAFAAASISTPTSIRGLFAGVALALIGVAAATALVVSLAGAATVRDWLDFPFTGIPTQMDDVLAILANNLRMLLALLGACLVAQLGGGIAQETETADHLAWFAEGFVRFLVRLCDCLVAASAVGHALLVGAGIGAYGGRMVLALLPQGPFELGVYSLGLALYIRVRREKVSLSWWLVVATTGVLGLLIAAPLEVFVAL
jgi:hypothetical protein